MPLMRISRNLPWEGREDLRKLVYRVMDGQEVDLKSLTKEQADYVKTTRVLIAKALYSDSWLEL